jgi:Fe2+ or Zn2+ uptake regulation protein
MCGDTSVGVVAAIDRPRRRAYHLRTILMMASRRVMTNRASAPRRNTWQRGAVLRAVGEAACHITADELYARVRRQARPIGLATVYRALEAFVRDGVIEPIYVGDGKVRYGLASKHHDHVVCLSCGGWEPLQTCLVPRAPRTVASGFKVTGHQVELYGDCVRCPAPA